MRWREMRYRDQMAGRASGAGPDLAVTLMLLLDVLTEAGVESAFFALLATRGLPAHPILSPAAAARCVSQYCRTERQLLLQFPVATSYLCTHTRFQVIQLRCASRLQKYSKI